MFLLPIVSLLTRTNPPQTPPKPTQRPPTAPGESGASSFGTRLEPVGPGASGFHKDWSPAAWVFGQGKMGVVEELRSFQLLTYKEARSGRIRQVPSLTPLVCLQKNPATGLCEPGESCEGPQGTASEFGGPSPVPFGVTLPSRPDQRGPGGLVHGQWPGGWWGQPGGPGPRCTAGGRRPLVQGLQEQKELLQVLCWALPPGQHIPASRCPGL